MSLSVFVLDGATVLVAFLTLALGAAYQRRHNVETDFRDGKTSNVVGTTLIGLVFTLVWAVGWAVFIPQALDPLNAVIALGCVDAGAGAGAYTAWHIMDSRDAEDDDGVARAEAGDV